MERSSLPYIHILPPSAWWKPWNSFAGDSKLDCFENWKELRVISSDLVSNIPFRFIVSVKQPGLLLLRPLYPSRGFRSDQFFKGNKGRGRTLPTMCFPLLPQVNIETDIANRWQNVPWNLMALAHICRFLGFPVIRYGVVRGKINGDMKVIRNSKELEEEVVVKWLNPRYTRPLLSFTFH